MLVIWAVTAPHLPLYRGLAELVAGRFGSLMHCVALHCAVLQPGGADLHRQQQPGGAHTGAVRSHHHHHRSELSISMVKTILIFGTPPILKEISWSSMLVCALQSWRPAWWAVRVRAQAGGPRSSSAPTATTSSGAGGGSARTSR